MARAYSLCLLLAYIGIKKDVYSRLDREILIRCYTYVGLSYLPSVQRLVPRSGPVLVYDVFTQSLVNRYYPDLCNVQCLQIDLMHAVVQRSIIHIRKSDVYIKLLYERFGLCMYTRRACLTVFIITSDHILLIPS